MKLGLISDTHGEIDPKLYTLFDGVDALCHAGDLAGRKRDIHDIQIELGAIAPMHSVCGNCDGFESSGLPRWVELQTPLGALGITHRALEAGKKVGDIDSQCLKRQLSILIYGHTHIPRMHREGNSLWINPGSVAEGRDGNPRSIAIAEFVAPGKDPKVRFYNLDTGREFRP